MPMEPGISKVRARLHFRPAALNEAAGIPFGGSSAAGQWVLNPEEMQSLDADRNCQYG